MPTTVVLSMNFTFSQSAKNLYPKKTRTNYLSVFQGTPEDSDSIPNRLQPRRTQTVRQGPGRRGVVLYSRHGASLPPGTETGGAGLEGVPGGGTDTSEGPR